MIFVTLMSILTDRTQRISSSRRERKNPTSFSIKMAKIAKINKTIHVFGTDLQTFLQQTDHFLMKYIQYKCLLHAKPTFVSF